MSKKKIGVQTTGYLLALGSAAAIAATFVVRKSISDEVNPATFSVWWYGLAGIYAWVFTFIRREARQAGKVRSGWKSVLALGLFNASAAVLYFTEIDMTNPALVSFFGRLRTAYVVLLGIIFLRERLVLQEWVGAGVTVLGTLIIAYKGGAVLNAVFLIALVENLLMAASTIVAKYAVKHLPPVVLSGYRGLLVSGMVLIYTLLRGRWEWVDGRVLAIVAGGAFIGPFLGYVLTYAALARLDAGKVAIISAAQPLFVIFYTALAFGDWPTFLQTVGGALTIVGVILVFRAQHSRLRR